MLYSNTYYFTTITFQLFRSIEQRAPKRKHIPKKRNADELFAKTLENQCKEGEAYCWSICQSLPNECNEIEQVTCIDEHHLVCK